jgi:hypothetical protein
MKLKLFGTTYSITHEEWTPEDTDDLKMLLAFPKFQALRKLIGNRIHARTEDLVNGKDTRDRIDELKDLILELQNYENS